MVEARQSVKKPAAAAVKAVKKRREATGGTQRWLDASKVPTTARSPGGTVESIVFSHMSSKRRV